jgi:hypothetical protein
METREHKGDFKEWWFTFSHQVKHAQCQLLLN